MIDKKFAGEQVGRMIGLNFFPTDPKAIKELVTALGFAAVEVIAVGVINDWLESQNQRPTPADLRRMVSSANERYKADQEAARIAPPVLCRRCGDCGLYGGYLEGPYAGPWHWCDCSAAGARRNEDPDPVQAGNEARQKLLDKFGPKDLRKMIGERASTTPADFYSGEF